MSEPIKPAMTKEEWEAALRSMAYNADRGFGDWLASRMPKGHGPYTPHEIAALALYGQQFGFTRKDVEILRRCETILLDWEERDDEAEKHVQELADRIESLLPPTEDQ